MHDLIFITRDINMSSDLQPLTKLDVIAEAPNLKIFTNRLSLRSS